MKARIVPNQVKNTVIISAFPGTGKTYLFKNYKMVASNLFILDSDLGKFEWISHRGDERNPDFPNNYIEHIKSNIGLADVIMVSSHDVVRKALEENDIRYTLVYPDVSLKEEYLERFKSRGNNEKFVELLENKWEDFINGCENEIYPTKIKLPSGKYLWDLLIAEPNYGGK